MTSESAADHEHYSRGFVGKCVFFEVYDVLVEKASKAKFKVDATVPSRRLAVKPFLNACQFGRGADWGLLTTPQPSQQRVFVDLSQDFPSPDDMV